MDILNNIAEIEITYNPVIKPSQRPKISSSGDAKDIFLNNWDNIKYYESFKIMLLNGANKVLGIKIISTGGLSGTVADPKMIFQAALKANASSIIAAHNHPSGNTAPSEADIRLTRKIKEIGILLELTLLDHLILTDNQCYSFADKRMM